MEDLEDLARPSWLPRPTESQGSVPRTHIECHVGIGDQTTGILCQGATIPWVLPVHKEEPDVTVQ